MKKICAFDKLKRGDKFRNCYDFKDIPTITLDFVKQSDNSALRIKPVVFEGRPIYFRGEQPVAPIPRTTKKSTAKKPAKRPVIKRTTIAKKGKSK